MSPLLALLPILGFVLLFKRVTSQRTGSALILAVSSILLAQYIFALAGQLSLGAHLITAAGGLALCFFIWNERKTLHHHLDLPLLLWTGAGLAFWFLHQDTWFNYYDEFSHWGIYAKELYYNHAFWADDPHIRHPRYVPGPALWIYFVLSGSPFSEGGAYFAQFLLLSAPLMLFFQGLTWKHWPWVVLLLAWIALALANWGHSLVTLYVDHHISVWFVGALLFGFYHAGERLTSWLMILPLCALVLIKDVGLFFALGAAGIVLLWTGITKYQEQGFKLIWARPLGLWLACCIIIPVVCVAAWKVERDLQGTTAAGGTLEGMYSKLVTDRPEADRAEERQQTQVSNERFWNVVYTQHISKGEPSRNYNAFNWYNRENYTSKFRLLPFPLSTDLFMAIFTLGALAMVLVLRYRDGNWKPWASTFVCLWLMSVFYIFVLHNHYTLNGSHNISSYMRYLHSMLMPLALAVIMPLLPQFGSFQQGQDTPSSGTLWQHLRGRGPLLTMALITLSFYALDPPHLKPFIQHKEPSTFRAQTMAVTEELRTDLPQDSRIWIHFPRQDNRFLAWTLQYQLAPLVSYVNNDYPDFMQKPAGEIVSKWKNYDYLWFLSLRDKDKAWLESVMGDEYTGQNLIETEDVLAQLQKKAEQ